MDRPGQSAKASENMPQRSQSNGNKDALAQATKQMRGRNMKKATGQQIAKGKKKGKEIKQHRQAAKHAKMRKQSINELRICASVIIFSVSLRSKHQEKGRGCI